MNKLQLNAIVEGVVQGIGFRATVLSHAKQYHLLGYVKNLEDNTVQILAQGTEEDLEKFLESLQNYPGKAVIQSIKKEYTILSKNFVNFTIEY